MHHVSRSSSANLRVWIGLGGLVLALSCGSCQRHTSPTPATNAPTTTGQPTASQPTVILHAGAQRIPFKVELARTTAEHSLGLMHRKSMPPDQGMLFIFPKSAHQTFWMKNTLIPLDMLFIDESKKIIGIVANAEPLTLSERSVPGDSLYVLEINGGQCEHFGILPGSTVDFVQIPTP